MTIVGGLVCIHITNLLLLKPTLAQMMNYNFMFGEYVFTSNQGCVRLTLFSLFRNKNKISKFSPDSQNNEIFS